MQKVQTFGNGVARGHVASQSVTTTPVTITLVKEGICFAGVEALTIKTDKDIYYSLANEDIEASDQTVKNLNYTSSVYANFRGIVDETFTPPLRVFLILTSGFFSLGLTPTFLSSLKITSKC